MGIGTAVAAIVSSVGAATGIAKFAFGVAKFVAITAATSALAKRGLKGSPELQARTLTSRGTIDPQRIIYGETLVAGTLAYRNAHGLKNREFWAVHALAGHECESILDVHLDDKVITNAQINSGAAAGGEVGSGDYGPVRGQNVVAIYKALGTSTQVANAELVAASSDWTNSHRLRGVCNAVTKFVLWDKTEKLWEAGDPQNVKFLVRGKKIYDPRLDSTQIIDSSTSPVTLGSGAHRVNDSTTWAWSDNPALCTADYLIDSKFSPLANGVDPARVDYESVAKAADVCDTLVFVPPAASPSNTQKRFTCNGILYGTDTPEENITRLLSSFQGELIFSGGVYSIQTGYEAPTESLSEDDIVGAIGVRSALDEDQRVNTLKAIYVDPDKRYEPTETAPIELYKDTRDGGDELIETINLDMTNDWYMAQRICQLRIQEANEELILSVPCNLRAARFVPGQRINLTVTERGWTPKIFKVLSWEFFDRGGDQIGVNLDLREDDAGAYSDPEVGEYNTVDGNGTLTFADPEPIPSLGTIPEGIQYGGGGWNITLTPNETTIGANDGEIAISAGTFIPPDGGPARTISSLTSTFTPYESSTTPPDGYGYLIWGTTNPDTRFYSGSWGESGAEAAGLFAAIYDRTQGQWYAVDDTGTETAFTPADDDVVVARFIKTSASGGLDSVTSVVAYVDDPQATAGAQTGVDLTDADGNIISDDVITNFDDATALKFNPGFLAYSTTPGPPDNWQVWAGTNGDASREETTRLTGPYAVKISPPGAANSGIRRLSDTTSPSVQMNFSVDSILIGSFDCYVETNTSGDDGPGVVVDILDGTNGYRKIIEVDRTQVGIWQRYYFKVSANDYDILLGAASGPFDAVQIYLMGAWSDFSGTSHWAGEIIFDNIRFAILSPNVENESQLWADISGAGIPADNADVTADNNNWSDVTDDDGNKPENNATNNTGNLADLDTVDTAQITANAVTDLTYASTAAAVTVLDSWVTVQTISVDSDGAPVLLLFTCSAFADPSTTGNNQFDFRITRDSTQIVRFDNVIVASNGAPMGAPGVVMYTDTGATGVHTYDVDVIRGSTSGNYDVEERALVGTPLKDS